MLTPPTHQHPVPSTSTPPPPPPASPQIVPVYIVSATHSPPTIASSILPQPVPFNTIPPPRPIPPPTCSPASSASLHRLRSAQYTAASLVPSSVSRVGTVCLAVPLRSTGPAHETPETRAGQTVIECGLCASC